MLYQWINPHYIAGLNGKSCVISLLLALLMALSRAYVLTYIVLFFLFIWQVTQLMYFHYYGGFYSGFDLVLLMSESSDAITGFWDVIEFLIVPASLSFAFFIIAILVLNQLRNKNFTVKSMPYILLIICFAPFLQALTSDSSQKFQPNIAQSSVKNGFYSFSYFLARQVKAISGIEPELQHYAPYQITKIYNVDRPNIIVIMGESLSYLNMGMFGYQRNTTPDIEKLLKDPNFIFKPSIASAVSTRVSLSLFFNTIYEPDNVSQISKMNTSLFRLAKIADYRTFYISTQKNAGGLTYALSPSDIDIWKENKHLLNYQSQYDDRLVDELKGIDLKSEQPQFITLHMRSAHTPYIENYPKSKAIYPVEGQAYRDYMMNSYDNSVLFTQKVIKDIIDYAKKQSKPTYVFFTSDHGELMGESGRFGHNIVDIDAAKVPFFFYGANVTSDTISAINNELGCLTNHYMISRQIAKVMGFTINNPNQQDDIYYLNGTDAFGLAGYKSYSLKSLKEQNCLAENDIL